MATVYTIKRGGQSLRLTPGGQEYHVGDVVPLTAAQYRSLEANTGWRFTVTNDAPSKDSADKGKADKPA